jgi:hypothetical protein
VSYGTPGYITTPNGGVDAAGVPAAGTRLEQEQQQK